MKLTKSKLKQIIKEELRKVLQEKLTPAQQRQADYDISKGKERAGISAPGIGPVEDEYRWGFAGDDPVDPEVFQRRPQWQAREDECKGLVYRRLTKLGDDTCMTSNICEEAINKACWDNRDRDRPIVPCGSGRLSEISDDATFLKCFKKHVAIAWAKHGRSPMKPGETRE